MFIVHNLFDGFDAYKIKGSTVEHFRSYHLAAPKERNVPLSCIFIEGGKYVALGTTMGRAMILDAEKVSTKQVLHHCGTQIGYCISCIVLTTTHSRGWPRSGNRSFLTYFLVPSLTETQFIGLWEPESARVHPNRNDRIGVRRGYGYQALGRPGGHRVR